MKLKVPEFLTRRPAFLTRKPARPRPPQKLRAATAARRMSPAMDDDYEDEPTTRLSSAFFVVLILHVVAVGGIYAFNSIKAHRRSVEPAGKVAAEKAAPEPAPVMKAQPTSALEPVTRPEVQLPPKPAPSIAPTPMGRTYTVKAGDTLTRIAATLGVTVADLQAVNPAKEIAVLRPGQVLNVPAAKTAERFVAVEAPATSSARKVEDPEAKSTAAARTYAVKKGDTATSIAKRFGTTVDELLKLNKVSDPKKLQLGQALKLPAKK